MNVLQVTASVAASDGGPSTAVLNVNRHLRATGSNSMIIATDAEGSRGRLQVDTRRPVDRANAATLYCRRSWPYFLKNSWSMGWRTWRIAKTADVMHVHGIYLANSIWAYVASKLSGTPYLIQPHGTLEPYQQAVSVRRKKIFNLLIGNRIIRNASAIVAASTSEARHIQTQYPDASVVVVPLGVSKKDPRKPVSISHALEQWLQAPRSSRVIFLGRLAEKKRPELLAQAWRDMPAHARLLYVGPPQDWDERSLREHLPGGASDTVTFLPPVDEAGVAWCLSHAGIFVLPSENENFGIAVAEAMVYGCAVLSTAYTAATEHVSAAAAGIVIDLPSVELLQPALLTLLNDPSRSREMGMRGQQFALDQLSWTLTAKRLKASYDQACK